MQDDRQPSSSSNNNNNNNNNTASVPVAMDVDGPQQPQQQPQQVRLTQGSSSRGLSFPRQPQGPAIIPTDAWQTQMKQQQRGLPPLAPEMNSGKEEKKRSVGGGPMSVSLSFAGASSAAAST